MVDSRKPMVSVVMITYMHEAYIAEAIYGVLLQKCNFDVELIIADDCSPDKTSDVVASFKDHANFNWIKYIRHDSNKGMMGNFIWALEQASGKYLALCEGDDYWIDTLKLQMQVDLLESNNNLCLSAHNAIILRRDKTEEVFNKAIEKQLFSTEDIIIKNWFIPTCSIVVRNNLIRPLPTWLTQVKHGDLSILLLATLKGKIYYDSNLMGVYRKHDGGASANPNNSIQTIVATFNLFNKHSNYKYDVSVKDKNYRLLIREAKMDSSKILKLRKILTALKYRLPKNLTEIKEILKAIIK